MSISPVGSSPYQAFSNSVNAPRLSEIKAQLELANRQKAPLIPGTAENSGPALMPGTLPDSAPTPGSRFQAYA